MDVMAVCATPLIHRGVFGFGVGNVLVDTCVAFAVASLAECGFFLDKLKAKF